MQEYKFDNILSAKGKYWRLKNAEQSYIIAAMQKFGISNLLAKLLAGKNIALHDIPEFLDPKIKNMLPDPYILKDMEKAVERICKAIENREKPAIYGDYDVDGACATAILTRYFSALGIIPEIYIPDRIKEGYGVNTEALLNLKSKGIDLAISVDCGVTAFEPIKAAKDKGLDVIVIDHHLSTNTMPEAVAVVNPNRFDENNELTNLCAAGVCFLLIVATNRKLRELNFFYKNNIPEPDLFSYLDLVALGTVCDVMTLTGLNRAYVSQGLKILAKRNNPGLAEIADIAGLNQRADVYSLGFMIGPRINAAGRIGDCSLGAKILATDDRQFAKENAVLLNNLNKERQELEKRALDEAIKQAEKIDKNNPLIMVASEKWHPGVIGIVAGRLKEMFNKPSAVIAFDKDIGKASARSVNGVDFGSAITNAREMGLLVTGGGHKAAAGFTVKRENMGQLYEFLNKAFLEPYQRFANDNSTVADLALAVSSITLGFYEELEKLAPYGNGNSEPVIIIEKAKIVKLKPVGEKHMHAYISGSGLEKNSETIKGVCFNCSGTALGDKLEAALMKNISILGKLKKNVWNGRESIEFFIDDIIVY